MCDINNINPRHSLGYYNNGYTFNDQKRLIMSIQTPTRVSLVNNMINNAQISTIISINATTQAS